MVIFVLVCLHMKLHALFGSGVLTALIICSPGTAHALSFVEGTIFLEADTEASCTAQGGSYIEWYGQVYCTQSGDVAVSNDTDDNDVMVDFAAAEAAQIKAAQTLTLIGKTAAEAEAIAAAADVSFRVVERDGEAFAVTMDYRPGRINARVQNDIVVAYSIEGLDGEITNNTSSSVIAPTPNTPKPEELPEEVTENEDDKTADVDEATSSLDDTPEKRSWLRIIIDFFVFWK